MNIDPELAQALAAIGSAGPVDVDAPSHFDDMALVAMLRDTQKLMSALGNALPVDDRVDTDNRTVAGAASHPDLTVRVYRPKHLDGPAPLFVYFHGGGFILGDAYIEEGCCLALAGDIGCVVVSVDYRLSPQHRFPAAVDDCYAALLWVAAHADELEGDATRLAVGGSSAGGALAAAVALIARDRGGPSLAFQMLTYPVIDDRMTSASMRAGKATPLFRTADAAAMWRHYLGDGRTDVSPYAAPGRAEDLSGLPPAFVVVAEHDPLRDEGAQYGARLLEAGVPTEVHCIPGAFHGFDLIAPNAAVSRHMAVLRANAALRALA